MSSSFLRTWTSLCQHSPDVAIPLVQLVAHYCRDTKWGSSNCSRSSGTDRAGRGCGVGLATSLIDQVWIPHKQRVSLRPITIAPVSSESTPSLGRYFHHLVAQCDFGQDYRCLRQPPSTSISLFVRHLPHSPTSYLHQSRAHERALRAGWNVRCCVRLDSEELLSPY